MAYSYDRRAATDPIAEWNLEGLKTGVPVTLYHGTTRTFRTFDMSLVREDMVNKYYGRGIFLTPSKRVAVQYAEANRNIGFPPSVIADLSRRNPVAGNFLKYLFLHGTEGWDLFWKENGYLIMDDPKYPDGRPDMPRFEADLKGIDSNDLQDIADYILGSASKPLQDMGGSVNIFNTSTGMPGYVYDTIDSIGLNSKVYRPKVYTVSVTAKNPLVTKSKSLASKARTKGFDSVVFFGSDLVAGVPEVAVFDPKAVKVRKVEVLD